MSLLNCNFPRKSTGEFSEQTYRNNFENETFEKPPRKPHTDHRLISVIFALKNSFFLM